MSKPDKGLCVKNKGFTLVELLIVMIIIGALAGAYMLASAKVVAKANAIKIVGNMRALKVASSMHYAEKGVWPGGGMSEEDEVKLLAETYLDRSIMFDGTKAQYHIWGGKNGIENVFVKCFLTRMPEDGVLLREALKKIAEKKTVSLYNNTHDDKYPLYNGGDLIVMPIKIVE